MYPTPRKRGITFGPPLAAFLIAAFLCFPTQAPADASPSVPAQKKAEKNAAEPTEDLLGRSTPFGTVLGFMKAVEREDLSRATEYLDTQLLPKQARKLAQDLGTVLDAADLRELSRKPEGDTEDGLPPDRERIGVVKTGSGSHEILLDRTRGEGVPGLAVLRRHPEVGATDPWRNRRRLDRAAHLGIVSGDPHFGYSLGRLIGILLALPLSFAIARLATRLLLPVVQTLLRRVVPPAVDYPTVRFQWPICLLFMAAIFYAISLIAFSAGQPGFLGLCGGERRDDRAHMDRPAPDR